MWIISLPSAIVGVTTRNNFTSGIIYYISTINKWILVNHYTIFHFIGYISKSRIASHCHKICTPAKRWPHEPNHHTPPFSSLDDDDEPAADFYYFFSLMMIIMMILGACSERVPTCPFFTLTTTYHVSKLWLSELLHIFYFYKRNFLTQPHIPSRRKKDHDLSLWNKVDTIITPVAFLSIFSKVHTFPHSGRAQPEQRNEWMAVLVQHSNMHCLHIFTFWPLVSIFNRKNNNNTNKETIFFWRNTANKNASHFIILIVIIATGGQHFVTSPVELFLKIAFRTQLKHILQLSGKHDHQDTNKTDMQWNFVTCSYLES